MTPRLPLAAAVVLLLMGGAAQADPANNLQAAPANNLQAAPANDLQAAPANDLQAAPANDLQAAPANNLNEMFAALNHCLSGVRLAKGTEVTIQFMLNRRGGLIGRPRITYGRWTGDEADRRASAASIAQGFDHCLPVSITDALGGAIAGRLMAYRLRGAWEDKV
jgi:hypothetical protein